MTTWIKFASVFFLALLAFASGWSTNDWRARETLANMQLQHAQALADYQRMEDSKNAAIKKAEERAAQNRADADRAIAAVNGMRQQISDMPIRIQSATRAAIDEYATTAGELLADCAARYQRVAAAADRHYADARLMRDAWPTMNGDDQQ